MVFTSCYKEQWAAGFWSRKSSEWNNHTKGERENRLTADVIEKDTMIFRELKESIFEKSQNLQAFKKTPSTGWAYTWSVCPALCFPFLTDPFDDFPGKRSWAFFRRGHHGQGRVTTTVAPHLKCFSKPLYAHKQDMLLSLSSRLKKIKSGHLRQREERMRQKQSSEVTTKGTSCTYKNNAKGKVKFLQTPVLVWIPSVAMRMIGVFSCLSFPTYKTRAALT